MGNEATPDPLCSNFGFLSASHVEHSAALRRFFLKTWLSEAWPVFVLHSVYVLHPTETKWSDQVEGFGLP